MKDCGFNNEIHLNLKIETLNWQKKKNFGATKTNFIHCEGYQNTQQHFNYAEI